MKDIDKQERYLFEWQWGNDYARWAYRANKMIKELFYHKRLEVDRTVKVYLKNPATGQITELTEPVELITLEIS